MITLRSLTARKTGALFFIAGVAISCGNAALAIPSPELVIGSVSSLSQIAAVGIAMVSGAGAIVLRKLGIKPGGRTGSVPASVWVGLAVLLTGLIGLNIWQYRQSAAAEMARLQATLVRPAAFDGTKIQDSTLKETRFSAQKDHPLGISTSDTAALLATQGQDGATVFYDIRETGENAMGTLPGATHMRFPDFLQSSPLEPGQSVVLFCHNGNRSSETCEALAARGIDCRFVTGGIEKWIVEGRPFSDADVTSLADLRAIPEYTNKDTLLSTADFTGLMNGGDLQIVDTRYPGDFATGHLPGAVNIPIRALPTDELNARIAALRDVPTVAACYDRRSCFMSQVLGLELAQKGIAFEGRYTTPWDYFVPPQPKPHVQEWLAEQQKTLWSRAIDALSAALVLAAGKTHLVTALLGLAVLTRVMILPLALKSERDQIVTRESAAELDELKARLKHDPVRKARAIQAFYRDKGLTPGRNMLALLFLPVTMLGVSAAQQAGVGLNAGFVWVADLGVPDPTWLLPVVFSVLAGVYLVWAVAKTRRQAWWWGALGMPAMFGLTFALTAAANVYLCFALSLLLVQRAWVTGDLKKWWARITGALHHRQQAALPKGVVPLANTAELANAGNKAHRLSVLSNAGLPVPQGVVLTSSALARFETMTATERRKFGDRIWKLAGEKPCAVRSSGSNEDGAEHSFAGVFESVLDVTRDGIVSAVEEVNGSFTSARAQSYDGGSAGQGNILVQQMVDSEFAGVLFTCDPTAPGMAMIEMVRGCGDDLVSGRVTPESFRFGRYSGTILGDEQPAIDLQPLLELGKRIEALFGTPQDIEWTWVGGMFQIVQSRDITTLTTGSTDQTLRTEEWQRVLERFGSADPDTVVLEQDEMSEVLPLPTPLSFSVMGSLWAPGGSVDLACRDLGVPYALPEGPDGHLVNLFGKTYVDVGLKESMTLRLTDAQARRLRKRCGSHIDRFRSKVMPELHEKLVFWQAVDYSRLPVARICRTIAELHEYLVTGIYTEAEKTNILAGFTMTEANAAAVGDPQRKSWLLNATLPHSPTAIMAECARLPEEERKHRALTELGHRAMFDYELSAPRYAEAPTLLWPLLESTVLPLNAGAPETGGLSQEPDDVTRLAIDMQDLKEQAKHEALRVCAELRRACLALGAGTGLDDLIFWLTLEEITSGDFSDTAALASVAQARQERGERLVRLAPSSVSLTLRDCEIASLGEEAGSAAEGALAGTCVSGEGSTVGRVFVVKDETGDPAELFDGFRDGDILVCRMVNPAWLPWFQRSGAVLSEVGGWLSHMAIVAREKKVMMLVACKGLGQLEAGQTVTVHASGEIETDTAQNVVNFG